MTEDQLAKLKELRKKELQAIMDSPRATGVVVLAPDDPCRAARRIQGTYPKDPALIPVLPFEGCSSPGLCECRYEPFIGEVGP